MSKIFITQEAVDPKHVDYIDRVLRNIRLDHFERITLITQEEFKNNNSYMSKAIKDKIKQKLSHCTPEDYLYRYGSNEIYGWASTFLIINNKKAIEIKPSLDGRLSYEECFNINKYEDFIIS